MESLTDWVVSVERKKGLGLPHHKKHDYSGQELRLQPPGLESSQGEEANTTGVVELVFGVIVHKHGRELRGWVVEPTGDLHIENIVAEVLKPKEKCRYIDQGCWSWLPNPLIKISENHKNSKIVIKKLFWFFEEKLALFGYFRLTR